VTVTEPAIGPPAAGPGRPAATQMTLARALNAGLAEAMRHDPKVVLLGEDIGALGGVFRVTDGLQREFGPGRVMDTPLAESGIVGTAIGLALRGFRPVCEIQFDGFIYPAFDQIVSQLAKMRARSQGALKLPVTIRVPCGGGIGAVEHHSESNEAYFCHTAGLRVVACATPPDGYVMIQQAIACDDPVIFYEPKRRYWDKAPVTADPPAGDALPLGKARVAAEGSDVTVVSYGPAARVALDAAVVAAQEGRSVEVVDLRSLSPLDYQTLFASAAKTRRVVVVHEAPTFAGLGAEIAAAVTEHCFDMLEAPVLRVGGYNIPYPPSRTEDEYLPDTDRVLDAIDRVLDR
jgi:2-oxoisovalerate dehydrogenase E1 component beta subunit